MPVTQTRSESLSSKKASKGANSAATKVLHRGWVWLPLALANVLIALTVLLFSVQVMVGHNPNVVGPLAILLRFLGTTT